jgi:hypothetical protein
VSEGYERPTLKLTFQDPEMQGLDVRAERLSIGRYVELTKAYAADLDDETNRKHLAELVMEGVTTWNLTRKGEPVPATPDGLLGQDFRFLVKMTKAILEANRAVPDPLDEPSSDGAPSQVASIPMDIGSNSPPS